jgi:malate/lactate dehydrogenase
MVIDTRGDIVTADHVVTGASSVTVTFQNGSTRAATVLGGDTARAAYRERCGVTIGLPTVVGRAGVVGKLEPSMSDGERRALDRSVATLRDAARTISAPG